MKNLWNFPGMKRYPRNDIGMLPLTSKVKNFLLIINKTTKFFILWGILIQNSSQAKILTAPMTLLFVFLKRRINEILKLHSHSKFVKKSSLSFRLILTFGYIHVETFLQKNPRTGYGWWSWETLNSNCWPLNVIVFAKSMPFGWCVDVKIGLRGKKLDRFLQKNTWSSYLCGG